MPETVKREYTGQAKRVQAMPQKRQTTPTGPKYPSDPHMADGKYEGVAASKTRLKSL